MRSFCLLLLALMATASAPLASPAIRAVPVAFDLADPVRVRAGALRFLSGWELTSRDQRFGGLSSMVAAGGRLVAVSDAGGLFTIGFVGGVPVGMVRGLLPDGPGDGRRKSDRDAESLTRDAATGRVWIGFEGYNAVWRYDPAFRRAEAQARPPAMRKWPPNGGSEALVRLADGRFLIFSEKGRGPGEKSTALLIFPDDPTTPGIVPALAGYRAPEGYAVTDVTQLPDGRMLLLHRRATLMEGVSAILSIIDPAAVRPGQVAVAREIARLAPPLTVDNMEALAVTAEAGRTIVWIASDDNFSPIQRTLLLKFALEL